MKTALFATSALLCALFSNISTHACVDWHPDSVRINILVDTLECNMILELSNLNMFGGNPNDFCSCGVYNSIPDGATIEWVAFVDSITQEPLDGFDLFSLSGLSGDSWDDADPLNVDWSGFVSEVNEEGLVAGQSVVLWIILDIPEENEEWNWICEDFGSLQEMLAGWAFGTDEWDNDNQQLADTHQSITYFNDQWQNTTVSYLPHEEYLEYITTLENFYLSIQEPEELEIKVFPNPASESIQILAVEASVDFAILNLSGQLIAEGHLLEGETIDVSAIAEGTYLLSLEMGKTKQTETIQIKH